jgi:hypothetical protein
VARKDNTSRGASMGLDLQGTPDPCTNGSESSQEGMSVTRISSGLP